MAEKKLNWSVPTTDGAVLKAMGDNIINRFSDMADNLHMWAVSAALHTIEHGDWTEIPRVLDKLSEKGFRSNALRAWFTNKTLAGGMPLKWVLKTEDAKAHFETEPDALLKAKERYIADPDAYTALLLKDPYWKLSKETEFQGFDLDKRLKQLYNEAGKVLADDKRKDNPKNNFKGLDGLRALVEGSKGQSAVH